MLGQNPSPDAPWPRFRVVRYTAAVRYDVAGFREELVRVDDGIRLAAGARAASMPRRGRAGMRPILGEQTQVRQATPRTETGQLQIWMTPHGFLKAAAAHSGHADDGCGCWWTTNGVVHGAGQVHRDGRSRQSAFRGACRNAHRQRDARRHARRGGLFRLQRYRRREVPDEDRRAERRAPDARHHGRQRAAERCCCARRARQRAGRAGQHCAARRAGRHRAARRTS